MPTLVSTAGDFTVEFYNAGDVVDGRTLTHLSVGFLHKGELVLLLEKPTAVMLDSLGSDFDNAAYYYSLALNQGGYDVAERVNHARVLRAAESRLRSAGFRGITVESDPSHGPGCTVAYADWTGRLSEHLEWEQLKSWSHDTDIDRLVVDSGSFTLEQLEEALA